MKFYSSILFKLVAGMFTIELIIMATIKYITHCFGENTHLEVAVDAAILSIFMGAIFFIYLKRPMNKIFGVIRAVKAGQFNVKTGISGKDEICELAVHVDEMTSLLQEARDKEAIFNEELRATNEELQASTDALQTAMAEQQAINAELEESKAEMEKKYVELERVHKLMMGREKRIIELKEENERLKEELEKRHES